MSTDRMLFDPRISKAARRVRPVQVNPPMVQQRPSESDIAPTKQSISRRHKKVASAAPPEPTLPDAPPVVVADRQRAQGMGPIQREPGGPGYERRRPGFGSSGFGSSGFGSSGFGHVMKCHVLSWRPPGTLVPDSGPGGKGHVSNPPLQCRPDAKTPSCSSPASGACFGPSRFLHSHRSVEMTRDAPACPCFGGPFRPDRLYRPVHTPCFFRTRSACPGHGKTPGRPPPACCRRWPAPAGAARSVCHIMFLCGRQALSCGVSVRVRPDSSLKGQGRRQGGCGAARARRARYDAQGCGVEMEVRRLSSRQSGRKKRSAKCFTALIYVRRRPARLPAAIPGRREGEPRLLHALLGL